MNTWINVQIVGFARELSKSYGTERSSRWNKVRKVFLEKNPACAVCGKLKNNEIHHVQPFHLRPDLELEENNLITLCRDHHFLMGHLMLWESHNKDIKEDASALFEKIKKRPRK